MDAQQLIWTLLSHALQVTALAIVVACTSRWLAKDRPHLAHALWLLVLLKCLMPPTLSSPTGVFSWLNTSIQSVSSASQSRINDGALSNDVVGASRDRSLQPDIADQAPLRQIATDFATNVHAAMAPSHRSLAQSNQGWQVALFTGLCVVLAGFVIGITSTIWRLVCFFTSAYVDGHCEDAQVNEQTKDLCKRFGIKRRVRVHVIQRPIGPVVVGWFRPTLLLPLALVAGKQPGQLEPLLAHELIHIRRGDLWWALVQTLATSLWWFHPLVHVAARMVSRESERSCDEETVASLGCSPATYARTLLEVLEQRTLLQVAPCLPGVRPIDITLERMERIMKLGQGSHQRTPRWIWMVLLVACLVALPSAAIGWAQEDKSEVKSTPTVVGPAPEAPIAIADKFQSYRCHVGDLMDLLQSRNFSPEEARSRVLAQLPARHAAELDAVASDLGLPGKMSVTLPAPRINDRELYVFELKTQVEAIKSCLAHLRKSGFRQVTCEAQLLTCAPSDYQALVNGWPEAIERFEAESVLSAKKIELKPQSLPFNEPGVGGLLVESEGSVTVEVGKWVASTINNSKAPSKPKHVAKADAFRLSPKNVVALLQSPLVECVSCPKVRCTSGQQISVATRSKNPVSAESGKEFWENTQLDIKQIVLDDKDLQVQFELKVTHSPVIPDPDTDVASQTKAILRTLFVEKVASGQTLFVGGMRLKLNGQDKVLMACITPTIGGFESKQVNYQPLIKAHVLGQTHQLPLLGPLTSPSKPCKLETPTDDELLMLIEKQRAAVGDSPLTHDQLPTFALRKVSEQTDAVRFVPLIGNAKLHHVIYECTLTRDQFPGIVETFYVDHNQFEMVP